MWPRTRAPKSDRDRHQRVGVAESALAAPRATFGGVDFYPDLPTKAAVLCSRLIRNHPLPDGNKRVAYTCMLDFLERNGYVWQQTGDDPDETVAVMDALAWRHLTEEEFARWVIERLRRARQVRGARRLARQRLVRAGSVEARAG
jgi:death-on-curing protein